MLINRKNMLFAIFSFSAHSGAAQLRHTTSAENEKQRHNYYNHFFFYFLPFSFSAHRAVSHSTRRHFPAKIEEKVDIISSKKISPKTREKSHFLQFEGKSSIFVFLASFSPLSALSDRRYKAVCHTRR